MLKNSKLIGESDNHYTIQLPSGHKMNLKKDGLHKKAQEIIKSLKGEKIKSYQDGGEVTADELDILENQPDVLAASNVDRAPATQSAIMQPAEAMPSVTEGAIPQGVPAMPSPEQAAAAQMPTVDQAAMAPTAQRAPAVMPVTPEETFAPEKTATQQQPVDALSRYKAALQQIGSAKEAEGAATIKAISEAQAKIDNLAKTEMLPSAAEIIKSYEKPLNDLQQAYVEKKIDPRNYYKNRTTGQKIMSGIGMLLSGFGAGISGQENLAFKMLQKAVQDDVDAQKEDKEEKMNLYKMNLGQMKNKLEARAATEAQVWTGVKYDLQKAAAKAYSQTAKAEALKAIALVDNEIQNKKDEMALFQPTKESTGGFAADTEAAYVNHMNALRIKAVQSKNTQLSELAKDMEGYLLPGVGVAKVKIDPKVRETLSTLTNAKTGLTQAMAWIAKEGPTLTGTVADAKAQRIFQSLIQQQKEANKLGVPNAKDIEMLEELVANPGSWRSDKAMAILQGTRNDTIAKERDLHRDYGVRYFSDPNKPKMITITNGQKSFEIEPQDLEAAMKDGYYVR